MIAIATTLLLSILTINAQEKLPVLKSNQPVLSINDGGNLRKNSWTLNPSLKPDIYQARLINGKPHKVTFISDIDSISFTVEVGKKYDFIVEYKGKKHYQQIIGKNFVPSAVFNAKYRQTHKGKTFVEIPEVYELVNIAFVILPSQLEKNTLSANHTDYYKSVRKHFEKHSNHPFILALDKELKENRFQYTFLKMNAYTFEFNDKDKIIPSKIYDRAVTNILDNQLRPYADLMQSFSDQTNFRKFYRKHQKFYQGQIKFFRKNLDTDEMVRWLSKNLPNSSNYDTYKIIFSPLVRGNQSVVWFESNGFKELQPHVEFPYSKYRKLEGVSDKANELFRGNIVFTEINHGFLNPLTAKYSNKISKATSNRYFWVAKEKGPRYYRGNNLFDEYMNWVLVNLRYVDYVSDRKEQEKLIKNIEKMMVERRGFLQFDKFSQFLVPIYRNRKPNQTIADLYPQIINWFAEQNKKSKNQR